MLRFWEYALFLLFILYLLSLIVLHIPNLLAHTLLFMRIRLPTPERDCSKHSAPPHRIGWRHQTTHNMNGLFRHDVEYLRDILYQLTYFLATRISLHIIRCMRYDLSMTSFCWRNTYAIFSSSCLLSLSLSSSVRSLCFVMSRTFLLPSLSHAYIHNRAAERKQRLIIQNIMNINKDTSTYT